MTVKTPAPAGEVTILGVRVQGWTVDALHAEILRLARTRAHAPVLNVNVHALNLATKEAWLRDFFNSAPIVFCDGAGVRLAARLLGTHLPPRITYADWIWKLAAYAARESLSLYLLGGRPGIPEAAAARLCAQAPGLRILGTRHGYFDRDGAENDEVIAAVNLAHPDILLVGFGMPLQERWLRDNWHALDAGVALSGGAVFDYASGSLSRAPRWMTDHGLEWLGRFTIEPRRLWYRYLVGNPLFLARILRQRLATTSLSRSGGGAAI